MDDMLLQFQIQRFREGSEFQRKNLELCRLANTMARRNYTNGDWTARLWERARTYKDRKRKGSIK